MTSRECKLRTRAALPAAPSASIRRRIAVKSEPMAVTTQEAVDGRREKAMRIASVEQIELGNIMELSITGEVCSGGARQMNLSGGLSLRQADGWNLKNHSHLAVARHLREKTHPSMLVVKIRDGEERRICSAALRELLRIVEDQIEERGVVIIVMNRESAIWRKASLKTVLRENQLKYVDVEETRVITNNRCIAEQIKHDKAENVLMDGSKVGGFGKVDREQKLKSIVMDSQKWQRGQGEGCRDGWSQNWKSWKIDEEMWCQSEEKLCKSIIKGRFARRNREGHAILADVEEGQEQDVIWFDDITGKELPWQAVRKAREPELKYLRDLVYEKVDEKEAVAKYGITPVDTHGMTQTKRSRRSPCRSDHEYARESSKVTIDQQ